MFRLSLIAECDVTYGIIHATVTEQLQYRRICTRWIPRTLSNQQKTALFTSSLQCIKHYTKEENAFFYRIITIDDTWIHLYSIIERSFFSWKYNVSPRFTKISRKILIGKIMQVFLLIKMDLFWSYFLNWIKQLM